VRAPPNVGLLKEQAQRLQRDFRGCRSLPRRLLDYEGAEFVLVGACLDSEKELAIELEGEHTADIFRKLRNRTLSPSR
jgi:hypothetical protein